MKNMVKVLTCNISILFIGMFIVNHLYAYALDLEKNERLFQRTYQSKYIYTKEESRNIKIYADIKADIYQEAIVKESKSGTKLSKDANINIEADICTGIEQTVNGKKNYWGIHLLNIGITKK